MVKLSEHDQGFVYRQYLGGDVLDAQLDPEVFHMYYISIGAMLRN